MNGFAKIDPQWTSGTVDLNGLKLHYLDTATPGPVLVCLHGTSMSSACWGHLAAQLRSDYRVIALDMRGHGQSGRPPTTYSMAEMGADVAGLVRALDLGKVFLIGSSVGNQVAVSFAAANPDRVAGLVLSDPSFFVSDTEIVKYLRSHHTRKRNYPTRAEAEAYCTALPQRAGLSGEMHRLAMQGDFRTEPDGSTSWAYDLSAITKVFLNLSTDQSDDIAAITAPVLILNADRSNVLGADQAHKLAADFADAELIVIKDSNHTIWGDQPDVLADRVRRFLNAKSGGSQASGTNLQADRYADLRAQGLPTCPDTFNFGADVVDVLAATNPDHLALICCNEAGQERRFSFRNIADLTDRLAAALAARGVGQGDRVLVMLPRIPEWQIAMVAVLKLGAIAVPCVTMLTAKDIAYRMENSGARAVITTAQNTSKFDGAADDLIRVAVGQADDWEAMESLLDTDPAGFVAATVAAEDPAVIFYTSGSTGLPKGVTHAARALFAWRGSAEHWLDLGPDDVMFCTADTGWSKAGTSILFGPWSRGSTVLFYDGPFDPERRIDLIKRYKVSVFCAAATEIRHLVALDLQGRSFPDLRLTVSAGESLNPAVLDQWQKATQTQVLEAYGLTETLMLVANYRDTPVVPGAMGRPLPGLDVVLIGDDGALVAAEGTGEIALRLPSPQMMLGYWNDPARTQATIRDVGGTRYLMTNDTARRDAQGYLHYQGRSDDVINSAGYRIGPQEVENALIEHAAVKEVAVVPSPDAERGEIVKAFVVLHTGITGDAELASELQRHVRETTAPYKYPRQIAFVPDLPKSAVGKLQRRELKQQERAAYERRLRQSDETG